MPETLALYESRFLDKINEMSAEEISLVVRVFATSTQGSSLFFLELDRAVSKACKHFSNTALIEVLTSLTLIRELVSQNVFASLANSANHRLLSLTAGQLIEIVRLFEYNQMDASDCKQRLLAMTRNQSKLALLSLEHLMLSLETLNFLGLPSGPVVAAIEKLVKGGQLESEVHHWSCSSSMTVLSIVADNIIIHQLQPSSIAVIIQAIAKQIPHYNANQIPNMLQALVRLDEEWDNGTVSSGQFLQIFETSITAISEHIQNSGDLLQDEQRLFAANFLAKLCRPAWHQVALELSTSPAQSQTAN